MNLLPVWGDPTDSSAYTVDLYPVNDQFAGRAVRRVLVYARTREQAIEIARREGLRLELEPRDGRSRPVN